MTEYASWTTQNARPSTLPTCGNGVDGNPDKLRAYRQKQAEDPKWREASRQRAREWYVKNRARALETARQRNAAQPKKGRIAGAKHHNWRGDNVGYFALHAWVERQRGKPSKCDHCGCTDAKRFEWANVDHKYRRVVEDWLRLCTSCHRKYDYANGLAKKGGRRKKET